MIILLDLDGTLTDTAHLKFKDMKDGIIETDINQIIIFPGVKEFIQKQKTKGHDLIIASDSHPKYVKPIAEKIFGLDYISLCDKPNTEKVRNFLFNRHLNNNNYPNIDTEKDSFLMIGDSFLDIELGRRLNIRTILTKFYKATSIEKRDGIGEDWKPIKMGPTYYANSFDDIDLIIDKPNQQLLALEAIFQNEDSDNMVKFLFRKYDSGFTAFRCLARQEDGECDRFAKASEYYQIDNPNRTLQFLQKLSSSITNYLKRVEKHENYKWDYLTYVSDKVTTKPPNKMQEIFNLVDSNLTKIKLFEWSKNVQGSLRNRPSYKERREFISAHLNTIKDIDLQGKSIIIIDDQFTSSATANEISSQLRNAGAKNILFVALFYLILPIESKTCPNLINGKACGKALKIKIKKSDGSKFYSCLSPKFGGDGCGYIENIKK